MNIVDKLKDYLFDLRWSFRRSIIHRWIWAIKHRFAPDHQYNKLNTGLPPGYYDPDIQILYGVMNTFSQFMKDGANQLCWGNEKKEDHPYLTDDEWEVYDATLEETRQLKVELDAIYDWWINRYLRFHDAVEQYWNDTPETVAPFFDGIPTNRQIFDMEHQLEQEANDMLSRLMKYRSSLWYA